LREIEAAGFVLFRREPGGFRYLTLRNALHGDVGFPKGHVEPGEGVLAAALRETEEETGLGAADVRPSRWFRGSLTYRVRRGMKAVTYLAAEADRGDVRLSGEHNAFAWCDLDEALARIRHANLRAVLRDAAVFLKDPVLRRGLDPASARSLLEARVGSGAPVVAHTREVASVARAIAVALASPDADYIEAAAWLHDVGRAVAHDNRHPLEGFRLVVAAGHPGYAPPCLSHYAKGASPEELGLDDPLVREMCEACDLETFDETEQVIALSDALAAGPRRVMLEERYEDLARRYGASPFFERNLRICRGLKASFEARIGRDLYGLLGITAP